MNAPNLPGKSFDLNKIRKMPFCPEKIRAPNHLGKPNFINEASLAIAAEYFILVLLCDFVSVVDWVGRAGGNPA